MTKILALITALAVTITATDSGEDIAAMISAPIALTQHVCAGFELRQIEDALERHKIYYDQYPRNEEFPGFMDRNFHSRTKDPKLDMWGQPYFYATVNEGGPLGEGYILVSGGPDRTLRSEDDLVCKSYQLRKP